MVSRNPLFHGGCHWEKFSAMVIHDIWHEMLFFTLIAVMVCLVSNLTEVNLGISNDLLTVLGTVLGLVISFRTTSAYERYQDGRKMWTVIAATSKSLAQMIWVYTDSDRKEKEPLTAQTDIEIAVEKKTMINLIHAFAVAVKHLLRNEPGVGYQDLHPLICFLPHNVDSNMPKVKAPLWYDRKDFEEESAQSTTQVDHKSEGPLDDRHVEPTTKFSTWSSGPTRNNQSGRNTPDIESAAPQGERIYDLKPARNPPKTRIMDLMPLFRLFRWIGRGILNRIRTQSESDAQSKRLREHSQGVTLVESHIPQEILLVLSNYSAFLMKHELLHPAVATGVMNNLILLQDTLSQLERICNTPLPFAYQAHLRMSLWIYLLFLPFQIFKTAGWITIPGTCFASFLLLGFLEIGQEIENPFNYDINDLDLDYFCRSLQRELHQITAYPNPDPCDLFKTHENRPLAPVDCRGADELCRAGNTYQHRDENIEAGLASLRCALVQVWKEVDYKTRSASQER